MIASTQTNHPLIGVGNQTATNTPLDQAFAQLRRAGLRITQPRIAIISALLNRSQPCSIEQIHSDLADGCCDLVTVYRCLAAFEEIGLVRRSFFHNGTSLYEMNLSGANRYHVVSKVTRSVQPLDSESTEELRAAVQRIEARLRSEGFTNVTHVVEFFAESANPATTRSQSGVNAS